MNNQGRDRSVGFTAVTLNAAEEKDLTSAVERCALHVFPAKGLLGVKSHMTSKCIVERTGSLPVRIVERGRLQKDAKKLAGEISRRGEGIAFRCALYAGTGVGKSTKLPMLLAIELSKVCVVVVPDAGICEYVCTYVRGLRKEPMYSAVSFVDVIREESALLPLSGAAVVYVTATDMLSMLYRKRDIFSAFNIGFVYIDEFHESIPQYTVLNWLMATPLFENVAVMVGTATGGRNLEDRVDGEVRLTVNQRAMTELSPAFVEDKTVNSMLRHGKWDGRVLVLVSNIDEVSQLVKYYKSKSVRCYDLEGYNLCDLSKLNSEIKNITKCVLVGTSRFQTAYTFDVGTVIDCGMYEECSFGDDNKHMSLKSVFEDESMRTQRCGRVGRLSNGVAYTVYDDELRRGLVKLRSGSAIYTVLWAILFQLEPYYDDDDVGVFDMMEDITISQATVLLMSKVHPLLMIHYVTNDLRVGSGTVELVKQITGVRGSTFTPFSSEIELLKTVWYQQQYVLGDVRKEFYTPVHLPERVRVFGYAMWVSIVHGDDSHMGASIASSRVSQRTADFVKSMRGMSFDGGSTYRPSPRKRVDSDPKAPTYRSRVSSEESASDVSVGSYDRAKGKGREESKNVKQRSSKRNTSDGYVSSPLAKASEWDEDVVPKPGQKRAVVKSQSFGKHHIPRDRVEDLVRDEVTQDVRRIQKRYEEAKLDNEVSIQAIDRIGEFGKNRLDTSDNAIRAAIHRDHTYSNTQSLSLNSASDTTRYVYQVVDVEAGISLSDGILLMPLSQTAIHSNILVAADSDQRVAMRSKVVETGVRYEELQLVETATAACDAWNSLLTKYNKLQFKKGVMFRQTRVERLLADERLLVENLKMLQQRGWTFSMFPRLPTGLDRGQVLKGGKLVLPARRK